MPSPRTEEDPVSEPDITTIEALHCQLYAAMQLEHATIPVYLTAFYSVITTDAPVTNIDVQQILRVIVVEEMLHLTIAANLMNAVGGKVDLTQPHFLPPYPQPLPDGENDFVVGLGPLTRDVLETFLKIERPSMAPDPSRKTMATHAEQISALTPQPPGQPDKRYHSIGDFYAAIAEAISFLENEARARGETIFTGDPDWQAKSFHYYSGGGALEPITDLESAKRGIDLIIEQGEGESKDPFGRGGELAHYYRFQQIEKGQYYLPGDTIDMPTGPKFRVDLDSRTHLYPIKPNIRLEDYPPGSELAAAARAFNRGYRDFLRLLTRAFGGHPDLLTEAVPHMFALRNAINELVRNPLPGTHYHAGPTFEMDDDGCGLVAEEAREVTA
jgi:hypothetical protein